MNRLISSPTLVAALVLLTTGWIWTADKAKFELEESSKIWVSGTSTLHDWECPVTSFTGAFSAPTDAPDAAAFLAGVTGVQIDVPAAHLACENGMMHKKAQEALEARQNPNIRFVLDAVQPAPGGVLKATGRLTLAGVTRPVTITGKAAPLGSGRYRITGQAPLLMSDFGMDAPTAMLGTIKTGDKVVVHFDVTARAGAAL